jgi:hypothetical protein
MRIRRLSFLLVVVPLIAAVAAPQSNPRLEGAPKNLVLTFKCQPDKRPALRAYMVDTGLKQLGKWKNQGILDDFRVFFSRYTDNDNWDMMLILSFPDAKSLSRWKEIEKASPAGLAAPSLALVSFVSTTPADLSRSNFPRSDNPKTVFLVIPYDYTVSTDEYLRYLDGYVTPQLDGWHEEKALQHYDIFIARYGTARPWSALLVLQYASDEALGSRERVAAKVRSRLKEDSTWEAFAESKQKVRIEKEAIVSDELR